MNNDDKLLDDQLQLEREKLEHEDKARAERHTTLRILVVSVFGALALWGSIAQMSSCSIEGERAKAQARHPIQDPKCKALRAEVKEMRASRDYATSELSQCVDQMAEVAERAVTKED